ncbi:MAG: hypothetical protein H6573_28075 [Lewinellaceae bacterium]|nr:LysM peptidoglycan-binding domain-containing protein [Phaeodactylibacter sp.]MCB0612989.1 LysM peptidoglycan-binding domain-containing protein [Phaeodactylibacter sp.]MCB9351327.1 hypothetical protein [Lewinellaceae bacterium]
MSDGELTKVVIRAFKNKKLTVPVDEAEHREFKLPVNPESYSKNYKVEYDTKKGQGNQGTNPRFKSTAPEELKIEFIFDGTDTIEGYTYPGKPVAKQIDHFLNTVYNLKGEIHKPHFLKVVWGNSFTFDCILTSLDLNYTLFKPNGEPLRAKASATFLNYIEQEKRVKKENKKSPDLTHVRQVKEGDTLPLMVYNIYGDVSYYLQVARKNGLSTIRQLKVGTEMIFPPVVKNNT